MEVCVVGWRGRGRGWGVAGVHGGECALTVGQRSWRTWWLN